MACRAAQVCLCAALMLLSAQAQTAGVRIAATVNEDAITTRDVDKRVEFINATAAIPQDDATQKRLRARALQGLIDETLQLQEAKRQGVEISDDEVEKALDEMGRSGAGSVRELAQQKGLDLRSLKRQVLAQISWSRMVQRKLRRNVIIADDEVARAQRAKASAPPLTEYQLTVLSITLRSANDVSHAEALARDIAAAVQKGQTLPAIAQSYKTEPLLRLGEPFWRPQDALPPSLQQPITSATPGKIIGPVQLGNNVQFVLVSATRQSKPAAGNSEVLVKYIKVMPTPNTPPEEDDATLETLHLLRANPGSCSDASLPTTPRPATARFTHGKLADLPPELAGIVAHLGVGEAEQGPDDDGGAQLLVVCERIDPAGALPDADEIRQELFSEKIDLEAQKLLRNLRREATIDIKGES